MPRRRRGELSGPKRSGLPFELGSRLARQGRPGGPQGLDAGGVDPASDPRLVWLGSFCCRLHRQSFAFVSPVGCVGRSDGRGERAPQGESRRDWARFCGVAAVPGCSCFRALLDPVPAVVLAVGVDALLPGLLAVSCVLDGLFDVGVALGRFLVVVVTGSLGLRLD